MPTTDNSGKAEHQYSFTLANTCNISNEESTRVGESSSDPAGTERSPTKVKHLC